MSVSQNSENSEDKQNPRHPRVAAMPPLAIVFLILTAAVSLLIGHYYLTNGDDLLQLWSDAVATIGQAVHIQRFSPLVIDPFAYHGIIFSVVHVFGLRPLFLRLPSLIGFLIMQVCLFYFVQRIASTRAGLFALAIPGFTGAFVYTLEIRPYGVLLGLLSLATLSWQTAARREKQRTLALVMLSGSLAVAINAQYFAVLIMLPLCAAEFVRVRERGRLDIPVLISLAAGLAGMVFLLPFLKGAAEFRSHYMGMPVPYQVLAQSYSFLLFGHSAFSTSVNHLLDLGIALLVIAVLWMCVRQRKRNTLRLPDAEFVFLFTLAGLPAAAFLLGRLVTHAMEPRYALGAIIGICALLAIAITPLLRSRTTYLTIAVVLFAGFAWKGAVDVRAAQVASRQAISALLIPPAVKAALLANPTHLLYTQDIDLFAFLAFHEPDPDVFQHVALVYSAEEEMRWNGAGTDSRIVTNLKSFTNYKIVPYESIIRQPGEHLFAVSFGGWNWSDRAIPNENRHVRHVGDAFGSEVLAVGTPEGGVPK